MPRRQGRQSANAGKKRLENRLVGTFSGTNVATDVSRVGSLSSTCSNLCFASIKPITEKD
jgi:hypothetical protein